MVDRQVIQRLITLADIDSHDAVYEIGTGTGSLTEEICRNAETVISSEVDYTLYKKAKERLASLGNLRLENTDGFELDVTFDILVASLPYSRSRRLIEWLACRPFTRAVVIVQEEFADKVLSHPQTPDYSAISVIAQRCFRIQKKDLVPKGAFTPIPQVESVILSLEPRIQTDLNAIRMIHTFFSFRRKQALSMLKNLEGRIDIELYSLPVFDKRQRVTDLDPDELFLLANKIGGRNT